MKPESLYAVKERAEQPEDEGDADQSKALDESSK
jgi:hypothetical protein